MSRSSESADVWEKHYGGLDVQWGTEPNVVLTALLADLTPAPGTALDLGCGHGGEALWLAAQGWNVTPVDVSQTALDRVAARAEATGLSERIHPQQHDLSQTFPHGAWDLVTATYFHTPVTITRDDVLRRAVQAVAPGGG